MKENRRVLVVEDELELLDIYEYLLSRRTSGEDYELTLVRSGEAAVEAAREAVECGRPYAVGFVDVHLGVLDGISAVRHIRTFDPEMRFVIVTADQDYELDQINALFPPPAQDAWDYLNKPFSRGEIIQKARQMTAAWNRMKRLERITQELLIAERYKGISQVARGVGHELGNIFLRILGKTDLALQETEIEKIQAHLQVISSAVEKADLILRNLQSFSKPTYQKRDVRLVAPVEAAIDLVKHEWERHSIQWAFHRDADPVLCLDATAMTQVLLNLFINANQSMIATRSSNPLPRLDVRLFAEVGPQGRPGWSVVVQDNGPGMLAEVAAQIFEYGFTTRGDRGSGLGLSISLEIVRAHGGNLTVRTEAGQGSAFTVWLPAQSS